MFKCTVAKVASIILSLKADLSTFYRYDRICVLRLLSLNT